MRLKFRLLPIALAAVGALLIGKVAAMWLDHGTAAPPERLTAAEVLARISPASGGDSKAGEEPAKKGAKDGADKKADAGADKKAKEKAGKEGDKAHAEAANDKHQDGETTTASNDAETGLADENFDPMTLTRAEIELLQGLSARRVELEKREREYSLREEALVAAEKKLDEKIAALEEVKKTVEGLLKTHEKESDEQIKSLVKIYESMKPKDAARILEGLDADTLLAVVERMKESKTAPILALLDPERAKQITQELISRNKLPERGKADASQGADSKAPAAK